MIRRLRSSWRMWREIAAVEPPTNVRVVGAGSIQQPVDCVYDGYADGVDYWLVVARGEGPVFGVAFDRLPEHSAIVVTRG